MIISGFRRCGVFPFNADAIDCSISASNPEATLQLEIQDGDIEDAENADWNSSDKELTISDEQEQLF